MGRRIGSFGLVNYREHPTEKNYMVFNFNSQPEAEMFGNILKREVIWFEMAEEDTGIGKTFLFAVKSADMDRAQRANFEVTGKFKKPMIRNAVLRYGLIIFFLGILAIGIVGYVKNDGKMAPGSTQNPDDSATLAE
jgi:hypothetical protein